MTAPAAEPKIVQIMDAFCRVLIGISTAAGYYNTLAAAGIEPIELGDGDAYPYAFVEEESSDISESNPREYRDALVLAVHAFIQTPNTAVMRTAHRLRDDLKRVIQTATKSQFLGADGRALVNAWGLAGKTEILDAVGARSRRFVEVVVRVQVDYKQAYPAQQGIF